MAKVQAQVRVYDSALVRQLSWLEHHPLYQTVVGSIPGQGACGRQLIGVSLSLPTSSLSKINKHILG